MILALKDNAKFYKVANYTIAGQTAVTGDTVDALGFSRICYVVATGDVTTASELTVTAYEGDQSDMGDEAEVSGSSASFTAGATDADNKLIVVDCPVTDRYVRVKLSRGTANAVLDSIIAILYNGKNIPVDQPSEVIASAYVAG